jgi:hypothetical protein
LRARMPTLLTGHVSDVADIHPRSSSIPEKDREGCPRDAPPSHFRIIIEDVYPQRGPFALGPGSKAATPPRLRRRSAVCSLLGYLANEPGR